MNSNLKAFEILKYTTDKSWKPEKCDCKFSKFFWNFVLNQTSFFAIWKLTFSEFNAKTNIKIYYQSNGKSFGDCLNS